MRRIDIKISVLIPMYNAEKYIAETLNSILGQTCRIDEILVVDDGSSDHSCSIIEGYITVNQNVRLIRQPYNQGVSNARNRGISEARNEWILLVDADDVLEQTLVEKQVKLLQQELLQTSVAIAAVHPAYIQIDGNSRVIENSEMRGLQLSYQDLFGTLMVRNHIITPTGMLINKKISEKVDGFRSDLHVCEDVDFFMRLAKVGRFLYIDEVLVKYRRHLGNVTGKVSPALDMAKTVIGQYSFSEIEEAILGRSYSETKNKQDLVRVLYQLEQYERGYEVLQKISSDENLTTTLFLISLYAIQSAQTEWAYSTLNKLVSMEEHNVAACNNLAIIEATSGNFDKARTLLEQCLMKSPAYLDAAFNLKLLSGEVQNDDYRYTYRELRPNLLRYGSL